MENLSRQLKHLAQLKCLIQSPVAKCKTKKQRMSMQKRIELPKNQQISEAWGLNQTLMLQILQMNHFLRKVAKAKDQKAILPTDIKFS